MSEKSKLRTEKPRMKKKIKMLAAILAAAALAVICAVLLRHPELFIYDKKDDRLASMYSDTLAGYVFYPSDFDLDVEANEHYMGLDRSIHLQIGGENIPLSENEYAAWGEATELFGKYFKAAIYADVDAYNALFTEAYYKTADPYALFAPQMIYGITIEEMNRTETYDGTEYMYNVTYAIYQNDGTFRNDIDSDAYKTLIFYLVPEEGELKIDKIDYYRQKN